MEVVSGNQLIDGKLLYLKRGNRATEMVKMHQQKRIVERTIEDLLNEACLSDLSTLTGRLNATRDVFHMYKNIPIYISSDVVLFQTSTKAVWDNMYINASNVLSIAEDETGQTVIMFFDHSILKMNRPYRLISQYYEKCLKIKKPNQDYL